MKLKLIYNNGSSISEYSFSHVDSSAIITKCKQSGKQWSDKLVGFFINNTPTNSYAAIAIKGDDHVIECMEYRDIETSNPEFIIDTSFLAHLSGTEPYSELSLAAFESTFFHILAAPSKARRWEVYPEINKRLATAH